MHNNAYDYLYDYLYASYTKTLTIKIFGFLFLVICEIPRQILTKLSLIHRLCCKK